MACQGSIWLRLSPTGALLACEGTGLANRLTLCRLGQSTPDKLQTVLLQDGLLSYTMRELANMPDDNPKWILLDGDLDANWCVLGVAAQC